MDHLWDYVPEKLCRACLQTPNEIINIFDNESDSKNSISNKILECTTVQIEKAQDLPMNICKNCLDKLNTAYDFKMMLIQSDEKLRHIVSKERVGNSSKTDEDYIKKEEFIIFPEHDETIDNNDNTKSEVINTEMDIKEENDSFDDYCEDERDVTNSVTNTTNTPHSVSFDEENAHETAHNSKRKRKIDKEWKLDMKYIDKNAAEDAIKSENIWSFSYKNTLSNGDINCYYRCNKVKFRGQQCQSGVYLHYPVDSCSVILYRSGLHHNCDSIANARPKLSSEIKEEINKLLNVDNRVKPKVIMTSLITKGYVVPKKTLINNYLADVRRKQYRLNTNFQS